LRLNNFWKEAVVGHLIGLFISGWLVLSLFLLMAWAVNLVFDNWERIAAALSYGLVGAALIGVAYWAVRETSAGNGWSVVGISLGVAGLGLLIYGEMLLLKATQSLLRKGFQRLRDQVSEAFVRDEQPHEP
jgi:hypothetical protein